MICGTCHSTNPENRIQAENGWIKAGQEFAEFEHSLHKTTSPHYGYLTCITCHDQHKSTVYEQGGIKTVPSCESCHEGYEIEEKEWMNCIDCHMPFSAVLAAPQWSLQGDARSHIFRIWVTENPRDSLFYTDETGTYVKTDPSGIALGNTLDLVCQRCHDDWTLEELYPFAEDIHSEGLRADNPSQYCVSGFNMKPVYPNPFNSSAQITFVLSRPGYTRLAVYDCNGGLIKILSQENLSAGEHSFKFDGTDLPSGIYFCRLQSNGAVDVQKIILTK